MGVEEGTEGAVEDDEGGLEEIKRRILGILRQRGWLLGENIDDRGQCR